MEGRKLWAGGRIDKEVEIFQMNNNHITIIPAP